MLGLSIYKLLRPTIAAYGGVTGISPIQVLLCEISRSFGVKGCIPPCRSKPSRRSADQLGVEFIISYLRPDLKALQLLQDIKRFHIH